MEKKKNKILANSLIVRRKDYPPIYAISQKFSLVTKPFPVDPGEDISFKKVKKNNSDYVSTGLHNFFPSIKKFEEKDDRVEFPRVRRKRYMKLCREGIGEASRLIPYDKRIHTCIDLSSLQNLKKTNLYLKKKIKEISRSFVNRTVNIGESADIDNKIETKGTSKGFYDNTKYMWKNNSSYMKKSFSDMLKFDKKLL